MLQIFLFKLLLFIFCVLDSSEDVQQTTEDAQGGKGEKSKLTQL